MRFVRVAAFAVLPSLALLATTANATTSCWYPNEVKAAQLRDFQVRLMVGTLQCRGKDSSIVELYNAFITKQRGLLDSNAQVLKTHFVREHGVADSQGAYDRFATALANDNSATAQTPDHCAQVDMLVRTATAATQQDLLILAQSMSDGPVTGVCPPSNYNLTEAKVPERPSPAISAPTPQPAVVAEAAPAAAATVQPAVVAAAPTSREDALQAAIVALQSATAALQAASASTAPADSAPTAKAQAVVVKVDDAPIVPPNETVEE